jgi:hypothetical protein
LGTDYGDAEYEYRQQRQHHVLQTFICVQFYSLD